MDEEIVKRFASLFPYERDALVAALRRDANALLTKAYTDAANSSYYLFNHRIVIRLVEVLSPKLSVTLDSDDSVSDTQAGAKQPR